MAKFQTPPVTASFVHCHDPHVGPAFRKMDEGLPPKRHNYAGLHEEEHVVAAIFDSDGTDENVDWPTFVTAMKVIRRDTDFAVLFW